MPGTFISHSSADNTLIRRMAVDLACAGIPVWLDSHQLELSDRLHERIFSAIQESTFFILALSSNALRSEWVNKELEFALMVENSRSQKFVIPIMLEDCQPPNSIADRIYLNIRDGYSGSIERLISFFGEHGLLQTRKYHKDRKFPIRIHRGTHVSANQIYETIDLAEIKPPKHLLKSDCLVWSDDEAYLAISRKFDEMSDALQEQSAADPRLISTMQDLRVRVRKLDRIFAEGIVEIANSGYIGNGYVIENFIKVVRSERIAILCHVVEEAKDVYPALSSGQSVFSSSQSIGAFYKVDNVTKFDLFDVSDRTRNFSFFLPDNCIPSLGDFEVGESIAADGFESSQLFMEFVAPQMVFRHFFQTNLQSPLAWNFVGWRLGYG